MLPKFITNLFNSVQPPEPKPVYKTNELVVTFYDGNYRCWNTTKSWTGINVREPWNDILKWFNDPNSAPHYTVHSKDGLTVFMKKDIKTVHVHVRDMTPNEVEKYMECVREEERAALDSTNKKKPATKRSTKAKVVSIKPKKDE